MYDTSARVRLARSRARARRKKRERRKTNGLIALCTVLLGALGGSLAMVSDPESPALMGLYGAMLLHEDAGGYVLVAVTAFAAAVVITVLCIRYRERIKKHQAEEESPTSHEENTLI